MKSAIVFMKPSNIKKNLQKRLKNTVQSVIYNRGLNYFNSGNVKNISLSVNRKKHLGALRSISIAGDVKGTKNYKSYIVFDLFKNDFLGLHCSCPYGDFCKHSVALGLKFISRYADFLKDRKKYSAEGFLDYLQGNGKLSKPDVLQKVVEYKKKDDYSDDLDDLDEYDEEDEDDEDEKWDEEYYDNYYQRAQDKKTSSKDALGDYRIILSGSYSRLSLEIIGGAEYTLSAQDIIKFNKNLSASQKKLFKFIEGFNPYYEEEKYWRFFELLKEAGTAVYWEKEDKKNEFYFVERTGQGSKLKVEISRQKNKYNKDGDIYFKLDNEYHKKKLFKLLASEKGFVVLEWNKISFMELPKILISIISRACKEKYAFGYNENYYEAVLLEEEIINLNNILDASFKCLNFSTNLEKHYKIQKFNVAEPCVIIDYSSKKDVLDVKIMVDYGFKKIDVAKYVCRSCYMGKDRFNRWGGDKYIIKIRSNNIFYSLVMENLEISLYKTIYANWQMYGFKRNITCKLEGAKEIYKFIDKNLPYLEGLNYKIEYVRDKLEFVNHKFSADFDVDLNAENDLLSFDVACYCGEDKISLEVLRKYMKDNVKNGYIKLDDGRLWKVSNEEEIERFILMLEAFYEKKDNKFVGRIYNAPELEGLFENSKYYKGKMSDSFNKFMDEAKRGKSVKKIKLPLKFDNILRDYQKEGINWFYFLRKYRFGGILADDMGTGKTLQTLTLLNMNRTDKPSIVICPKSLLYNWIAEVEKFTPCFKSIVLDGMPAERMEKIKKSSQYDLIITSYATMQPDFEYYEEHKIKFNYCVLDEAQFIKNHKTKNARSVKKIDADYRLVLTGTPLENSVSEIWSIFDFLMPGFLGHNANFTKRFQNPIMKRSCNETLNNLRKKIECFMLRRTKDEVLKELPPKIEQYNYCYLEPSQNILYQEILANVRSEIFKTVNEQGFAKSQIHILAGLTKLRQICNHPNLLLGKKDYTKYESAKLNIFNELIGEIISSDRKVLVFSQFTTMLDILSQELKNVPHNYLSGKTNNRQELVDDFNNNADKKIFLISLKAGGTGLNLTSADNVIIFDPWWNPSVERQAIDRTHRIGQTKSVNVYRFITKGTIEEKILKLQEKKKFLFDNLIGQSGDLFKKLTWDEVKELFK